MSRIPRTNNVWRPRGPSSFFRWPFTSHRSFSKKKKKKTRRLRFRDQLIIFLSALSSCGNQDSGRCNLEGTIRKKFLERNAGNDDTPGDGSVVGKGPDPTIRLEDVRLRNLFRAGTVRDGTVSGAPGGAGGNCKALRLGKDNPVI
ncbi:unnamed protein product [Nesidiocoris tenuis]|uniref:Uncharacterized protein n=1 Tax=Nesidiocoris tenuis TaxID=355587 RepID=A0A6H5H8U9_9HEMI|nr:unnamed protein product [Nesidiocoris tenuis]